MPTKLRISPLPLAADGQTAQTTMLRVPQLMGDGEDPLATEMRTLYNRPLAADNNLPAFQVARNAAKQVGINPALFISSAFQEGFNKAIAKPSERSGAYDNAVNGNYDNGKGMKGAQEKLDSKGYPVDGFFNYGLDTFSTRYPELVKKGYLPKDFNFKPYKAYNEKGELVTTAAFPNNETALMAKAAFMRDTMDKVNAVAKKKGITLDEDALNYFTLVGYNAGEGNADKMLDSYAKAKDKKAFIDSGDANWMKIHKNVSPRIKNMKVALELLNEKI